MIYRFEDCTLDTDRHELVRSGSRLEIEPQVFSVLTYLVEHSDRVARKEDILASVWGTTFISDSALATRIKEARRAIGDDGRSQRLIRTVHRVGYRFVGTIEPAGARVPASPTTSAAPGRVRFCTASDGVRIAFATSGDGPPFVKAANWLTHLEYDEQSPVWRHLVRELARDFTLVRYDERGCGLSDRELDDSSFTLEAWVRDLETVVDALGLDRFPLLGISQGGAVAVAYAAAHPERVTHLILQGAYARGRMERGETELNQALVTLTEQGWGQEHSAHAQLFASRMIPRGTAEQVRWMIDLQRISASRENAARFRRAFGAINVEHLLGQLRTPTLVVHSERDQTAPFEEGRRLAAGIPNARLLALDSDNHLVLEDEPAWLQMIEAIREFVSIEQ